PRARVSVRFSFPSTMSFRLTTPRTPSASCRRPTWSKGRCPSTSWRPAEGEAHERLGQGGVAGGSAAPRIDAHGARGRTPGGRGGGCIRRLPRVSASPRGRGAGGPLRTLRRIAHSPGEVAAPGDAGALSVRRAVRVGPARLYGA